MTKTSYARHKGVSRRTVYGWITKGQLVLVGSKIDMETSEKKLKNCQPVHPWHDPDKKVILLPGAAVYSKDEDLSDIRYQPLTVTVQEAADIVLVPDDVYPPAASEDELRERVLDAAEALELEVNTVDIDGDDQHIIGIEFYDPKQSRVISRCDSPFFELEALTFLRWLVHTAGGDAHRAKRICAALFMVLANRHDCTGQRQRQFTGKGLIILPDQPKYTGEGTGIKAITGGDPVVDLCAALYFMSEPKGLMMGGGGTWAGQPEPKRYLYHFYLAFMEYHGPGKPLSVEKFARAMKQVAREYGSEYLTRRIKGCT